MLATYAPPWIVKSPYFTHIGALVTIQEELKLMIYWFTAQRFRNYVQTKNIQTPICSDSGQYTFAIALKRKVIRKWSQKNPYCYLFGDRDRRILIR